MFIKSSIAHLCPLPGFDWVDQGGHLGCHGASGGVGGLGGVRGVLGAFPELQKLLLVSFKGC